ncbi:putative cytochrome P450 [Mycobacteroides stephanolepidis]|uniref:Putative cytochrome P450 n=1 Tax=[Mycobacterium] stephanolepidis TaxID=1520670 RepID=A0A1Z4F5C3_9MYCO|nr:putative cytochrome P450 [[Mycobacterium] stephanolepidis]
MPQRPTVENTADLCPFDASVATQTRGPATDLLLPRELAGDWGPLPINPTVREVNAIGRRHGKSAPHRHDPWRITRAGIPLAASAVRGVGSPALTPPGPVGRPFLGSVPEMRREPFEFFRRCANEFGDIYSVPFPLGGSIVVVNHPDYAGQVMDDPVGRYSMIGPGQAAMGMIGAAIPMLEGDKFRQRRRMLMPMFGRRHLARVAEVIADEFVIRVDGWARWVDTGQEVDLQHAIAQVTLPAFLRAMFSSSITEQEIHETDVDLRTFMSLMASVTLMSPLPNLLPVPGRDSAPRSMWRLWRLTRRLIKERRRNPIETPDLLSLLLEATYDDGSPLSERDLSMELMILMAGGYETVVASLSWTLALLLAHPDHLDRLYAEVDALHGAVPTPDDLPKLPWAKACFDEGQRLQGHPLNPRFAMEDDVIGGYFIPRYTIVGPSLYSMHRDPRWWVDPDTYDPDRFMDQALARERPRLAFMPFGSGRHHCLGTGMAYMNAQFLLAIIFQRYRLMLPPGWKPKHHFNFSVTLDGGLPVTLTRA